MGKYLDWHCCCAPSDGPERIGAVYHRIRLSLARRDAAMKGEINLLSPQVRADRIRSVTTRRMMALADALLVCVVLVVCSYGAAWWALLQVSASVIQQAHTNEKEYQAIEEELQDIHSVFTAVHEKVSQHPLWTPLIPDVLTAVPSGILLTKVTLSETPRALSLVGRATQGSAIVQYQRALEELSWVDHVDAPLQNFAVSPEATVTLTVFRKESPL